MDIDLSSLLVFKKIAESGSFTEAGRHWNIPQPSVSLIVGKLESAAGLVLFERMPTGVRLTSAGNRFLELTNVVCDAYLSFNDNMLTLVRRLDREIFIGIDRSWFGSILRQSLETCHPPAGAIFRFRDLDESCWEELVSSKYDIAVAGRFLQSGLSPSIQEGVILRERGITVAWNGDFYPLASDQFNFPEALRSTVLIPDDRSVAGFSSFLEIWCDYAYGFRPANVVSFGSEAEAASAAAAGLGVFLGPGDAIPRIQVSVTGLFHVRTFEFLLPEAYTFGVYCRSDEESNEILKAAAFINKLGRKLLAK